MSETTLPTPNNKTAINVDDRGALQYASAAATGHVEIMVPSLPGSPRTTETLHARTFGQHVIGKIESSMNRQGYMTTGPTQQPAEVLRHYTSVARGARLMDEGALKRMETLAQDFEREPEQREFFKQVVKPWLGSLNPALRKS